MESNIIKILAIDTSQVNLTYLKAMIRDLFPYAKVFVATIGTEGIEIATKENPDVILLNVEMPESDGFEICKTLKADKITCDIPIVFETAITGSNENRKRALECGAEGFLAKPLEVNELFAQIRAMVLIKESRNAKLNENERLAVLVEKKTQELRENHLATLNLLEDLKTENEKRRQSELALKESEQKFRNLFSNHAAVKLIVDPDNGDIVEANHAAAYFYGWTIAELKAMNIQQINVLSSDEVNRKMEDATYQKKNQFEFKHQKADKTVIDVEVYSSNIKIGDKVFLHSIVYDITKRKQAETALRESEKKYRLLFESNPQPMWVYDLETLNFLEVNKVAILKYGYSRNEFLKLNLKDIRPVEDIEVLLDNVKHQNNDYSYSGEWRHKNKNGDVFLVEILSQGINYKARKARLVLANDITERRNAEVKVLKLSSAVEQSPVSIIITDTNGNIDYVNPKVLEISGYKFHELVGKNPKVFSSGEKPKNEYKVLWETILAGKEWRGEFHNKKKNGELYWELASISPIFDENGKTTSYLAIKEDITERKKILQELVDAKEQAEVSEEKIKIQNNEILFNNERLESLLKVSQFQTNSVQELLDFALKQAVDLTKSKIGYIYFYVEEKKQFILNTWSKDVMKECSVMNPQTIYDLDKTGCWGEAVRQRKPIIINDYHAENPIKKGTPEGHVKLEKFLTIPVIIDNKIVAVAGVANKYTNYNNSDVRQLTLLLDNVWKISERLTLIKDLIIAKQKAEENDQLKTAFLSNMSHEIRTPMNAVLGFSQLISEKNISKKQKKIFAEYINTNGESLLKIIDDIIDISKIQSKQLTIKRIDFDLHKLFHELEMFYSNLLVKKTNKKLELQLQLFYPKDLPFIINSDEIRLKQILNNLISNAIKYSENGKIIFGYVIKNSDLQIFVKDTGVGIPKHELEHIFDRFVQYSKKYTSRQDGTGLGLAISKELVFLLDGELKVKSTEGKGATFYFNLPILYVENKPVENEVGGNDLINVDLSCYTILIADDEEPNYILTKRMLRESNVKTEWAKNGRQAVDLVAQKKIDLVLMDIKMPDMDGIEATRLIKMNNKNLPIIIQTAFALAQVKDEAFEAGCNDFIVKPIATNELLTLIIKQIANKQQKE